MENKFLFKEDAKNQFARSYFSLLKTAGWIELEIKKTLKPYGITHPQLNVLAILAKNSPEPMDAKSIKEGLIVPSPDLTRLLDRLVNKGLVNRKTCVTNRRKIDITITESGIELFYQLHAIAKTSVKNYFEDVISEKEAQTLFKILRKMRD